MGLNIDAAHRALNHLVQNTSFCDEEVGKWNTRLLYALGEFKFIGDIVRLSEDELYGRTQLGQNTMARLKTYLASQGLGLGMTGTVIDTWVRPQ